MIFLYVKIDKFKTNMLVNPPPPPLIYPILLNHMAPSCQAKCKTGR